MQPLTATRAIYRSRFIQLLAGRARGFASTNPYRNEERQWSTPLAKQLSEAISATGPVPLASYMRMCLTGDIGGYYTGGIDKSRDQFGVKGDFVTSPEISQVFGELVGIWFVAEWMSQGSPKHGVQLLEVGPGRGTLMDDILRTVKRFPEMLSSIQSIVLVEASAELRETQKRTLCGTDTPLTKTDNGFESVSKYEGLPIVWADSLKSVPTTAEATPFIVAHEFFDALPIYTFQTAAVPITPQDSTATPSDSSSASSLENSSPSSRHSPTASVSASSSSSTSTDAKAPSLQRRSRPTRPSLEWREMLVSPVNPLSTVSRLNSFTPPTKGDIPPEFQLSLSSGTTRHSQYLPETSNRYRELRNTPNSVIEVCPDASSYAAEFAVRIGGSKKHPKTKASGAALILDYGTMDTVPINSLRGIRHHKLVSPFISPGLVDLSADVDFTAVAEAATLSSEGVEVHGPVSQADFLGSMGIQQRAEMLIKAPGVARDRAAEVDKAWKRLVDRGPNGMGKVYKALAILPENQGKRRPAGFGGDVASQ